MRKRYLARRRGWASLLVLLAVVVTGVGTLASQAQAEAPAASASTAGARVYFYRTGDHFYLCDTARDGKSVAVEFKWYRVAHGDRLEFDRRWNWWGPYPNGGQRCKDINIDATEGSTVKFRACVGDRAKPGGKPAKVSHCGVWVSTSA